MSANFLEVGYNCELAGRAPVSPRRPKWRPWWVAACTGVSQGIPQSSQDTDDLRAAGRVSATHDIELLNEFASEYRDHLPTRHETDIVRISACETGSGKLLGEEGIASLERAFLLAGAKSVVASLWTADDIFTIALMKRFYDEPPCARRNSTFSRNSATKPSQYIGRF